MEKPSIEQNESYLLAFDHFNAELFDGQLPRPMLTFSRIKTKYGGYCQANAWTNEDGEKINEIVLNSNLLQDINPVDIFGALIHEMVHHWQVCFGTPTRSGYHNTQWSQKAWNVGLEPTDLKTGRTVGQSITTEVIDGGLSDNAIVEMPEEAFFPWTAIPDPEKEKGKTSTRVKYTCPSCKLNAWAKAGAYLICGDDRVGMLPN